MTTNAYTRPGYRTVTAGINLKAPEEFIAWAGSALGATPGMRVEGPDGKVMHAEVTIGDTIVALDRAVRDAPTSGAMFHVYVADADAAFARAVEAGATSKMPPMDMFWGERVGAVTDPFGNGWGFATFQREVSPEEMKAGAEAFAKRMANS